jgi:hypothetical protein
MRAISRSPLAEDAPARYPSASFINHPACPGFFGAGFTRAVERAYPQDGPGNEREMQRAGGGPASFASA